MWFFIFLQKQVLIVIFLSFHCSLGTALFRQARLDSKVRKPDGENIPTVKGNTTKAIEKKGHLPPISRGKNSSANTPDINQQSKDYSPKEVYVTPDEPFEGQIRNNSMYRWVYLPKREDSMPIENTTSYNTSKATQKNGHLRSILRHHSSAGAHDINQQSKDYTPKEVYVPPDEPFEGQTHNSMYRWVYLPKREDSKPEEVVNRSDMPFEDTTSYNTSKATQKKGHLPSILRHHSSAGTHDINQQSKDCTPKDVYVTPDEPFEGLTVDTRKNVTLKYEENSENFKPAEVVFLCEEPFDETSDKAQFPKRDPKPRKVYSPKEVACRSKIPFDDTTSEKTKLPKLDAKPHKDYSPKQVSVPPDVPLGDLTI